MRVERGFQPNCSEVVFFLEGMSKQEVLEILKDHGIYEITIHDYYEWRMNDEPEVLIADDNNPNLPDFSNHAIMRLQEDYVACGSYTGGTSFVGHQHCQHQLFPTMHKIASIFDSQYEWHGDDGGSIESYEEWVNSGAQPIDDYQTTITIPTARLDRKGIAKLRKYAQTLGLGKANTKKGDRLIWENITVKVLPQNIDDAMHNKSHVVGIHKIRKAMHQKAEDLWVR
jgi:hypothetical protein